MSVSGADLNHLADYSKVYSFEDNEEKRTLAKSKFHALDDIYKTNSHKINFSKEK